MNDDCRFMDLAIALAREAGSAGEVPVGCLIVREGEVVGRGQNLRERRHDATAHAEIEAIRDACRRLGRWRLSDCTLYVTLEPCPMCAGAIWNARIPRVVFGAADPAAGCCGSVLHLGLEGFSVPVPVPASVSDPDSGSGPAVPGPEILGGVREHACRSLLEDFFRRLRIKKREI